MKKIIVLIFTILSIISCKNYSEDEILINLKDMAQEISNGKNIKLDSRFTDSLYNLRKTFPYIEENKDVQEKLEILFPVYANCSAILGNVVMKNQGHLNDDIAKVFSYILHLSARLIPQLDDLLASFDKNDPSFEIREQGLETAYDGLVTMIIGFISSYFVEDHGAKVDMILFEALESNFAILIKSLPEMKQESLLDYLKQNIEPNIRYDLKNKYLQLLSDLDVK